MAFLWRFGHRVWMPGLLVLAACSADNNPLTTVPLTNPVGDDTGNGPTGNDPTGGDLTGGDPTTTGADSSGSSDSSGGSPLPPSMETCERYLDCLAVTAPGNLPEAQQGFGPNGTCWDGPPESQMQCIQACQTALEHLHSVYPDEPACGLCQQPEDCGQGMTCEAGECVEIPELGCGDGIVQPDETCETLYCEGCQDATCNPFSHVGCTNGDECRFAWYGSEAYVECLPKAPNPTDGQDCEYSAQGIDYCAAGLVCAPAELLNGCLSSGCCTRLCNLQEPDECPNGRVCQSLNPLFSPHVQYVGVCVLL